MRPADSSINVSLTGFYVQAGAVQRIEEDAVRRENRDNSLSWNNLTRLGVM